MIIEIDSSMGFCLGPLEFFDTMNIGGGGQNLALAGWRMDVACNVA